MTSKTKTRWKFLRLNVRTGGQIMSEYGNLTWQVGRWQKVDPDKLSMCEYGLHCSKTPWDAFSYIPGEVLAKVEVRGQCVIARSGKEAWSDMRIVKIYKLGEEHCLDLVICVAESLSAYLEEECPGHDRPRKAIEAARALREHDTRENREAADAAAQAVGGFPFSYRGWPTSGVVYTAAWYAVKAVNQYSPKDTIRMAISGIVFVSQAAGLWKMEDKFKPIMEAIIDES